MMCCPACFNDAFIREIACKSQPSTGTCECCGVASELLMESDVLVDYFEPLIRIYSPDVSVNSLPLVAILRRDWGFFDKVEDGTAESLLKEMFPDLEVNTARFIGVPADELTILANWDVFREELKHKNRFFRGKQFELDVEGLLFVYLKAAEEDIPNVVYRGRIWREGKPYKLDEMGAPKKEEAPGGRANPRGIPYLYVASDADTVTCELRPHPGECISVASFAMTEGLTFADLRDPRGAVSPFGFDEDDLLRNYGHITNLSRLAEELSQPISPRSADLEYLPSQYLSEFIKHCGFDGIIYKSSVSSGVNYALFDESNAMATAVESYQVDPFHVNSHKIGA
jgi:hypothetical protein